jgi:hypothetical protein
VIDVDDKDFEGFHDIRIEASSPDGLARNVEAMFRVEINVEKVAEPVVSLQKAEALYEEFKLQFPEKNT